ncbi:hypothetical protein [Granulicella paludicola]|nr:hypothetical protein [Granulicella paludicola]
MDVAKNAGIRETGWRAERWSGILKQQEERGGSRLRCLSRKAKGA